MIRASALALALLACTTSSAPPVTTPSPTPSPPPPGPVASIPRAPCGRADAPLTVDFRVEVDREIRRAHAISRTDLARAVRRIACEPDGWTRSRVVRFRYDPDGSYLIGLRTRASVLARCRRLVGEPVSGNYSCAASAFREVVLNIGPWQHGTDGFPGPLPMYRRMLVNHELGHAMTLRHRSCPAEGARAPVMMQQSIGMNLNGLTCRPNPVPLADELEALRAAHA